MTTSLDPDDRKEYMRRGALSADVGLATIPIAVAGLIDPALLSGSSAAAQGPIVVRVWLAVYLLGAVQATAGVRWRPKPLPHVEARGLIFFIFALVVNAAAIVVARGPIGGGLTALWLLALAKVFYSRIQDLKRAAAPASDRFDRRVMDEGLERRL